MTAAENGDDEVADDEDDVESTIATAAPSFDVGASGMPSPISTPPSPLPITPASGARSPVTPAVKPALPSPIETGLANLGIGWGAQASTVAVGGPNAYAGAARKRPQTVIGLAPPHAAPRREVPDVRPGPPPLPPSLEDPSAAHLAEATVGTPPSDPVMGAGDDSLALFGIDTSAADAARAAVAPGPRPAPTWSPLASTGYARPSSPNERSGAHQQFGELGEEESTRAVPREELFRRQDAQVVVGDDAAGDDATIAIVPGHNEANSKYIAALAQTMAQHPEGGFPPPPGVYPLLRPNPHATGGPIPPGHGWSDPQQGWGSALGPSLQGPEHGCPPSDPHLGSSSPIGSNLHVPAPEPFGVNAAGPAPMAGPPGQIAMPMQPNVRDPAQQGNPLVQNQSSNASPWAVAPVGRRFTLSRQVVVLAIVGVICVAIFIAGVVLFATTKF